MIFAFLFGCHHKELTRPMTPHHKPGTKAGPTYVVCLDCGMQFHYNLATMRIGEPITQPPQSGERREFQTCNY